MAEAVMGNGSIWARAGFLSKLRSTFFLRFTVVFAVAALVLSLVVGVAVSSYLAADIRSATLDDLEAEVAEVTGPHIIRSLDGASLEAPLEGEELAAVDTEIKHGVLSSRTVLVNVFNTQGELVYSSGEGAVTETPPQDVLNGQVVSDVQDPSTLGEPALGSLKEVVTLFVPLTAGDSSQVIGVAQVVRDFSPIAEHIQDIQTTVFISVAVALGVLYLALLFLVRRGSNTIRSQDSELEKRSQELKAGYDSIVAVLCSALDLRDNVTHGHAQRVSEIASVLAWQMGLRKGQLRQIEKAAILHDIGKIGVADAVLSKPGPLSDSEWEEMKRHPELGYKILKDIDFLKDAAEVVYAHHERFDGKGYPRGLKGEEIPLGARIFAVVDAYEAMTSHRPYRKALPHSRAMEEIARNAGTQFDPEVVRAFLEAEKRGLLEEHRDEGDQSVAESFSIRPGRTPFLAGD